MSMRFTFWIMVGIVAISGLSQGACTNIRNKKQAKRMNLLACYLILPKLALSHCNESVIDPMYMQVSPAVVPLQMQQPLTAHMQHYLYGPSFFKCVYEYSQ
jgi:hypothetical protein